MTTGNTTPDFSDVGVLKQWLREFVTSELHDASVELDDQWSDNEYLDLCLRRGQRTGATLRVSRDEAVQAGTDPTGLTARLRQIMLVL